MIRPWLAALLQSWAERLVPPVMGATSKPPDAPTPSEAHGASHDVRPDLIAVLDRCGADAGALLIIKETGAATYHMTYATGAAPTARPELLAHELAQLAGLVLADAKPSLAVMQ